MALYLSILNAQRFIPLTNITNVLYYRPYFSYPNRYLSKGNAALYYRLATYDEAVTPVSRPFKRAISGIDRFFQFWTAATVLASPGGRGSLTRNLWHFAREFGQKPVWAALGGAAAEKFSG